LGETCQLLGMLTSLKSPK